MNASTSLPARTALDAATARGLALELLHELEPQVDSAPDAALDPLEAVFSAAASAPAGFVDAVMDRVIRDETACPAPAPTRSQFRLWAAGGVAAAVAAAVIACVLAVSPWGSPLAPTVAWADVVAAVAQVDHVHITATDDDPRVAYGDKVSVIDFYHQRRGRFRIHVQDTVEIVDAGDRRAWRVGEGELADGSGLCLDAGFFDRFERGGVLRGFLGLLGDELVDAEPVRVEGPGAAATPGLAVFDYAVDPTEVWARVWVAEASGLPVSMKLIYAEGDERILVQFDYTDPQPAAFFDADAFAEGYQKQHAFYRLRQIGSAPVGGTMPIAADQVLGLRGGFRAPTFTSIRRDSRDVLEVSASYVHNPPDPVRGAYSEGFPHRLVDAAGNVWLRTGWQSMINPEPRQTQTFYAPAEPLAEEAGGVSLTLPYVVQFSQKGHEDLTLMEATVDIPIREAEPFPANNQHNLDAVRRAVTDEVKDHGTLAENLDHARAWTNAAPASAEAWRNRREVYERFGAKELGWAMWREHGLPLLLEDPFDYWGANDLSDHLSMLMDEDREPEARALVAGLLQTRIRLNEEAKHDLNLFHDLRRFFSEDAPQRQRDLIGLMEDPNSLSGLKRPRENVGILPQEDRSGSSWAGLAAEVAGVLDGSLDLDEVAQRRLNEADALLEQVEKSPKAVGRHASIVHSLSELIVLLRERGQTEDAERLYAAMERRRPNPADLPQFADWTSEDGKSSRTWMPRREIGSVWDRLVAARWEVAGFPDPWRP